jgi:tRNA pseudouridine55 synthase
VRENPDGVLLLDKPEGFSSTQALARAKRFLAARKAGHTGTLDPFATGLLPIAFGEATKFSRFLIDAPKSYRATLCLGKTSTTGDPEGEVTSSAPSLPEATQIDEVLAAFTGVRQQVPPMHSAVRVGGKRLYELAREGLEVERAARTIEIQALAREAFEGERLVLSVTCSKGTYVRTLAADIGAALGCGAYLVGLRRTTVGGFELGDAVALSTIEAEGVEKARLRLLPVDVLVRSLPRQDCPPEEALRFTQGQPVRWPAGRPGEELALYGPGGRFLGVGLCDQPGQASPARLMSTGLPGQAP